MSTQRLVDKQNNLKNIFRTVQKHGPIERKQIQELTQLSWGTVSQYTNALLQSSVLSQSMVTSHSAGKTPTTLNINGDDHYIIGVDFNFSFIRVAVLDLKGTPVKNHITPVTDGSRVIQLLIESLEHIIGQFQNKNILAISISVQGSIDEDHGIVLYLSFEPSWRNLTLKEAVESRFGIRTFTFHDTDCVLVAEKYFGSAIQEEHRNIVLLNANMGLGMSFMMRSKLYTSTFGHSGELGHITVHEGGLPCSCGKRGCLEVYGSKMGIVSRFVDEVNKGSKTALNTEEMFSITYESIRDHAVAGDPLCLTLFQQAGQYLGNALASVATILEPDIIILYGGFFGDRDLYRDVLEQTFQNNVYTCNQTSLCYSGLPSTAPVLGAAMYAHEKIITDFLLNRVMDLDNERDESLKE